MSTSLQRTFLIVVFAAMTILISRAQSPKQEIVVQAANSAPTAAPAPAVAPQPDAGALTDAIKALEDLKAKNNEILSKQQETFQRLDELQQAADQLRIFSKRG